MGYTTDIILVNLFHQQVTDLQRSHNGNYFTHTLPAKIFVRSELTYIQSSQSIPDQPQRHQRT